MKQTIDKGARAEEILRNYFRELGYFVVRGVQIKIEGTDITDIDLWLYNRPSPVTRERINVDIKNKKKPQAFERIFWAKGVQGVLGFDHCIVATSDKRNDVGEFGRQHGVTVLNGSFMDVLRKKVLEDRLSDEELRISSEGFRESKSQTGWYEKAAECSSVLVLKLGYDGCNSIVPSLKFFIEQVMISHTRKEEAARYTYLLLSYFLVGLDYALAETAFLSFEERQKAIEDGLRFGKSGKAATEQLIELASRLAVAAAPEISASTIQRKLCDMSDSYPVQILAEHFGRNQVSSVLFLMAKEFSDLALSRNFRPPNLLGNGLRAALFVFIDFFGYERKEFIDKSVVEGGQPSLFDDTVINDNETTEG